MSNALSPLFYFWVAHLSSPGSRTLLLLHVAISASLSAVLNIAPTWSPCQSATWFSHQCPMWSPRGSSHMAFTPEFPCYLRVGSLMWSPHRSSHMVSTSELPHGLHVRAPTCFSRHGTHAISMLNSKCTWVQKHLLLRLTQVSSRCNPYVIRGALILPLANDGSSASIICTGEQQHCRALLKPSIGSC